MACRAVDHALKVVLLLQFLTDRLLLGRSWSPLNVENAIARADVFLRRTVAIETPFHQQRTVLADKLHLVNLAVARRAADSLGDVDAVVEVHMVGQFVDAVPLDGFAALETLTHWCKQFRPDPDLFMAVHARLGGGHPGIRRRFHRRVAIPAIDAKSADMLLMAEWHRLIADDAGVSDVTRAHNRRDGRTCAGNDEHRAEDTHLRNGIETGMKDLRQAIAPDVINRQLQFGCQRMAMMIQQLTKGNGLDNGKLLIGSENA